MIRFSDDDLGYLAWIAAHPDGFVLNVRYPPDPHCVVLHGQTAQAFRTTHTSRMIYGAKTPQNLYDQRSGTQTRRKK